MISSLYLVSDLFLIILRKICIFFRKLRKFYFSSENGFHQRTQESLFYRRNRRCSWNVHPISTLITQSSAFYYFKKEKIPENVLTEQQLSIVRNITPQFEGEYLSIKTIVDVKSLIMGVLWIAVPKLLAEHRKCISKRCFSHR